MSPTHGEMGRLWTCTDGPWTHSSLKAQPPRFCFFWWPSTFASRVCGASQMATSLDKVAKVEGLLKYTGLTIDVPAVRMLAVASLSI